jgi:type IV pilus assembly protein PilV
MYELSGPSTPHNRGGCLLMTNRIHYSCSRMRKQAGSSLIEILISILIVSLGMMAVAGMQAYSVASQKNSLYRSIASSMANELAEMIRLNPAGLNAANYNIALMSTIAGVPDLVACPGVANAAVAPAEYPFCNSAANLAAFDITSFQRRVRSNLPIGGVEIVANVVAAPARSTADIWITWQEPGVIVATEDNADNCSANASALATLPRCFYMRVQL